MRYLFLKILILFVTPVIGYCTAQYPDKLIYKGDTIPIFANPLEPYLKAHNIDTLPDFRGCGSTACWRGYVAIWEIENDSLFLNEVTPCYNDCRKDPNNADLKELFGEDFKNGRVFAKWVSETLLAPHGRILQYVHMGYGSVYEKELHLTISEGILKNNKWITNHIDDPELIDRFNYDLMQDTLFHYIAKLDWDKLGNDLMCDDTYLITIGKKGKVKAISYGYYESKWEKFKWNLLDAKCRRLIKSAIKDLKFDQLLIHGKPQKEVIQLDLFWDEDTQKLELWKN